MSKFLLELFEPHENEIDVMDYCHDCGCPVRVRVWKEQNGGFSVQAQDNGATYNGLEAGPKFKCKTCYKADPVLRNYRPTEVYTRVVGYYRPTSSFNRGKQAEYQERQVFQQV